MSPVVGVVKMFVVITINIIMFVVMMATWIIIIIMIDICGYSPHPILRSIGGGEYPQIDI